VVLNLWNFFLDGKWVKKIAGNEKRKTKNEKRKTKNEKRKTKSEKRKAKSEKRKAKSASSRRTAYVPDSDPREFGLNSKKQAFSLAPFF
jgi:hypothetical protein